MSTAIYPPLQEDKLNEAAESVAAKELQWLLSSLQDTFAELRAGLQECEALLAPAEPGSTLVLSSMRSEAVKGLVTRVGTRVVKTVLPLPNDLRARILSQRTSAKALRQDVQLRLTSLPPPPKAQAYPVHLDPSSERSTPVPVPQLSNARNLVCQALDVVDASTWTGDPQNAQFIAGQLRLMAELVGEAKQALKGGEGVWGNWWEESLDEGLFDPPLPPTLSIHLTILDSSLQFHFRTLAPLHHPNQPETPPPPSASSGNSSASPFSPASFLSDPAGALSNTFSSASPSAPSYTGLSLRQRLGLAARLPEHDESEASFNYRGRGDGAKVVVREKVRVESADPGLMACAAKLGAVEHGVALARRSLAVVMGAGEEDLE